MFHLFFLSSSGGALYFLITQNGLAPVCIGIFYCGPPIFPLRASRATKQREPPHNAGTYLVIFRLSVAVVTWWMREFVPPRLVAVAHGVVVSMLLLSPTSASATDVNGGGLDDAVNNIGERGEEVGRVDFGVEEDLRGGRKSTVTSARILSRSSHVTIASPIAF
jgi:hypothetical protein